MTSYVAAGFKSGWKPDLISIISGFEGNVYDAVFISGENCILTSSEDRSLRLWVRRESGKFWPSVETILPNPAVIIVFDADRNKIYTGLDNGTISDFTISSDLNCLVHEHDVLAHIERVNGLVIVQRMNWIISTSKDKTVAWFSKTNKQKIGSYNLEASGTCLQFDQESNCLFVGDSTGKITLLGLGKTSTSSSCEVIREICGHTENVTSISWDSVTSRLLSGSTDRTVIMWDIGGGVGSAYELQGHTKSVTSVNWWHRPIASDQSTTGDANLPLKTPLGKTFSTLVVSAGLDGLVYFWSMDVKRKETPNWSEGDHCNFCASPFFWNFRKMWSDKSVGYRRHHCRRCGKAACEKCSANKSVYPIMGFEREVRVCNMCFKDLSSENLKSLACSFDARHQVDRVHLMPDLEIMLTIGKNKEVKVWDLKSFL